MQFESAETDSPPIVTILSPLNNSKYTVNQTIPIEVTATVPTGTITSVNFYNGTSLLYEAQTAPFIYNWTSADVGVFTIIAEATSSNGLQSSKFVTVTISDNQTNVKVKLRAGWNMVGCPLEGSTNIEKALASIWQEIETIKDMEGFYDVNNMPALNSLTTLEWGEGYLINIKSPCELIWSK
ncbi:MAG: hypothetical protein IPO21_20960 [Bacteroidales bacterium]|nr:hypothetical protein [Bacteroidales bacterium]